MPKGDNDKSWESLYLQGASKRAYTVGDQGEVVVLAFGLESSEARWRAFLTDQRKAREAAEQERLAWWC